MANLRVTSCGRVERLTDAETVRLGRVLIRSSETAHVSYPEGRSTVQLIVHDFSGDLPPSARVRISECFGEFDEELFD